MGDGWAELAGAVARAEAGGAAVGAVAVSPDGRRFAHRGGRRFVAASTVKIPILIELFRQVDAGRLSLDDVHTLQPTDKSAGSGVLGQLHDGIGLTLRDLAFLMMSISDNTATNILIDRVGGAAVNATMRDLGMAGSTLGRKMRGRTVEHGEQENWAVPEEYAGAIAALLENRAASAAACAEMVALLQAQQNDRRIARHLPRGEDRPRWGSKTGSLPGVVNDVGFVWTPTGPLVLAVFCEGVDPHRGEEIVGDVARAALADA